MIGSADKSNTPKNPFTYAERKQLISNIFQKRVCGIKKTFLN